ncbi:MAG: ADP-ribosylation factor-like protein [Asgard group archaeon]|nr:ADP-ribosylation factor-like protein [Asgard group archaeon]
MQKLILIGIQAAGKTALYQKYFLKRNKHELDSIQPTKGIARYEHDFLRSDVEILDLGGAKKYRKGYIGNKELVKDTKAVIYVIDVENEGSFKETINYLTTWTKSVKKELANANFYILFNKIDPGKEGTLKGNLEKIARMLAPLEKTLPKPAIKTITSIYSYTSLQIFQRILLDTLPKKMSKPKELKPREPAIQKEEKEYLTKPKEVQVKKPTAKTPLTTEPSQKLTPTQPPKQSASSISPPIVPPTTETTPEKKITDKPSQETPKTRPPMVGKSPPMEQTEANKIKEKTAERLTDIIETSLNNNPEFIAIAVFSENVEIVVGAVKEGVNEQILDSIKESLGKINLTEYMSKLGKAEIGGEGHLKIDQYDIFFEKVSPEHLSTVICESIGTETVDNIQEINRYLNQALSVTPEGVSEETFIRADLMSELKMKLYLRGKSVDRVG